jgi:two-component system, cell cycle response regulator DivK
MKSSKTKTPAKKKPAAGTTADDKAPLILVIDDFADNRDMYARFLEFSGFRVATGSDGQEALDKAFELGPDLIVMDLSLPGLDGWEATRRLKGDSRTKRTPVVAVTGHAFTGSQKSAQDAGCDGYISKPCLPADLVTEIRRVLAGGRRKSPKDGGAEG